MAVYNGKRINDGVGHQPTYKDGVELSPKASQAVINHSPDGFNWGYSGSGPAQLALALLLDVTGDERLSCLNYQVFKLTFVAGWAEEWSITSEQISAWLKVELLADGCKRVYGKTEEKVILKVEFKDGIPTCPCGSQQFAVTFREFVSYELDASQGSEGWGSRDLIESNGDPIDGIICRGCDEDIEVTPELEAFIRRIE